jgi:glutamate racemase
MHILITDSGVGGLSVCAFSEQYLRINRIKESVKLTYVNASPENDFGYNAMNSRREKIDYFNRFLDIVSDTYSPDLIYIACNTLSVLFSETEFSTIGRVHVQGIVETGVNSLLRELGRSPRSIVAIFGAPTTIEEGTYPNILLSCGIDKGRIISQACPSLADTISEDREGSSAKNKIEKYVTEAIEKTGEGTGPYLAYLACTHYGYRKDYFEQKFKEKDIDISVLNPNEWVAEELFSKFDKNSSSNNDIEVDIISRYRIPETALETIAFFLEDISPKTIRAFADYTYSPGLF